MINFDGTVGGNISGTADLAPLDGQADMLHELFPDAKKIGLLYCSAEANSKFQVDTIKGYLEKLGYTCEYYAFSDSNDLSSVCTSAANDSDVIMYQQATQLPTIQRSSTTSVHRQAFRLLQVKRVSAKDVVLQHFPSATMILV